MSKFNLIEQFCLIQLQVLSDRENRLRKEMYDCKIQREYLTHFLAELTEEQYCDQFSALISEIKVIDEE
jgi:hypothetical protein|tara:strand:- start:885 stop:1091 length:207 start_codon:yes stop_codon:yes gene_type:complete